MPRKNRESFRKGCVYARKGSPSPFFTLHSHSSAVGWTEGEPTLSSPGTYKFSYRRDYRSTAALEFKGCNESLTFSLHRRSKIFRSHFEKNRPSKIKKRLSQAREGSKMRLQDSGLFLPFRQPRRRKREREKDANRKKMIFPPMRPAGETALWNITLLGVSH